MSNNETSIQPDSTKPSENLMGHREAPGHGTSREAVPQGTFVLAVEYATGKIRKTGPNGETLGWDTVRLRSYNGKLVGPVIEARPGDTLKILLDNRLPPEPPSSHDANVPHGFNTTNLHVHGLHVSPAGNSDNVMLAIEPGQQFFYEVKIPEDHPAGTFWYHGHKHGSVAIQLASGMAGPLIIRGDIDEVPAIKAARERIFMFQQIPYLVNPRTNLGEIEGYDHFADPGDWAKLGRRTTINGEVEPTIEMMPGEVQRWRFIEGSIREGLRVRLVSRDARGVETPIHQHQIAMDGLTTGRIDAVQETELYPGYRVDVLVRATDARGNPLPLGNYWLVDATPGVPPAARVLARVIVRGSSVRMRLPVEQDLSRLAPHRNVEDREIKGKQEVRFHIDLSTTPPRFLINDRPFDPNAPPRKLRLGVAEEWSVSSSEVAGHPYHIHVNAFQCTLPDGRIVWKDTIFVPPKQTVRLRTRYERYIGTFVLHCHILPHEDLGMMEVVEIEHPSSAHGGHDHGGHNHGGHDHGGNGHGGNGHGGHG
jgi:FtsP/CotA-like multicopper oxidase with cupredoxin domain